MDKVALGNVQNCPVTATMQVIGGKWKILILYLIFNDINRFGKMGMMLKDISKQMLTSQLRELENDGIIERRIYPEIPPRVEYFLTAKGRSLEPVISQMRDWGNEHLFNIQSDVATGR
ncbi:helix-turn-helix transcriptional regulator [Fulvivirgaceae bacterium PWU4]|uniref:Helix-turn-helix transcriptional regulator n=1 Tax=Chryseosolibacter histidini TaxID=2782349 RepID=A0AAP2GI80_9BACT|nr:helix-turn-helix domain-containing protein [Chryseosolibacter histidini]MBT1696849.1 helix-turn-helix transcriptional regulator [Chryseosolibacter histidini]